MSDTQESPKKEAVQIIKAAPTRAEEITNAQEEIALLEANNKKARLEVEAAELAAKLAEATERSQGAADVKEERRLNMAKLRQEIEERKLEDQQRQQDRESQGRTFVSQRATDEAKQAVCTHKKGGIVSDRNTQVLSTGGNGQQYSVIKHQMINGDIWVRCLRCGKTWSNPVKENFYFNVMKDKLGNQIFGKKRLPATGPSAGVFNQAAYEHAVSEYLKACVFESNNSMSGSVQCRFTKWDENANDGEGGWMDATEEYRKRLADTTLR
jgi:hypothetical protein